MFSIGTQHGIAYTFEQQTHSHELRGCSNVSDGRPQINLEMHRGKDIKHGDTQMGHHWPLPYDI